MRKLFDEHGIDSGRYQIFSSDIETFATDKKYDIVIAEGFLQNLRNQDEVIGKLKSLLNDKGIAVITCSDDVCMFVESMKRLLAQVITKDVREFGDKVDMLVQVFEPQLKTLRGVSRPVEDWVKDQLMNPAGVNGTELTLAQAIEKFGHDYYVLGASPSMFTDYSWYKDVWVDQSAQYREQFDQKRLSLLLAGMSEVVFPVERVEAWVQKFEQIKSWANEYEVTHSEDMVQNVISALQEMEPHAKEIAQDFALVMRDMVQVFREPDYKAADFARYPHFFQAFGRTLQYISFEKI